MTTHDAAAFWRIDKHRKRLGLAIILAASILASGCRIGCWFVPCDRDLTVIAHVTDPSGTPLQDVHIDVLGHEGESGRNGCLELGGVIHSDEVVVGAAKPGYKAYEGREKYDYYQIDIVLEPVSSPQPSRATWKLRSTDAPLECNSGSPAER